MSPASRRLVTAGLIVLSAVSALVAVGARPTSTTVYRDGVPDSGTSYLSWSIVFVCWLLVVATLAAAAAVQYLRGRREVSGRLLLGVGIMGLVPAILPGVFAPRGAGHAHT